MEDILVPIFVCVVLPVAIVLIVFLASINSENKRAKVLIKAIESNCNLDADRLAEAFRKPKKSAREILNGRLLRGCMFSLIGLSATIFGCVKIGFVGVSDEETGIGLVLIGAVLLAVGISYLIVYFVTRKQVSESEKM